VPSETGHSNPFAEMEERIVAGVTARLVEAVALEQQPAEMDFAAMGLEPLRAYTVGEAAHLLGIAEGSVYKIPPNELPRVRRNGTAIGFLGINILCYMHQAEPVDVAGLLERMRRRLTEEADAARPVVRPLNPTGKTRVL